MANAAPSVATDPSELADRFQAYMDRFEHTYDQWVCGVSEDAEQRLAQTHRLERDDAQMIQVAGKPDEARAVIAKLEKLGCQRHEGGALQPTDVYIYLKQPHTEP